MDTFRNRPWLGDKVEAQLRQAEGRRLAFLVAIVFGVPLAINVTGLVLCRLLGG